MRRTRFRPRKPQNHLMVALSHYNYYIFASSNNHKYNMKTNKNTQLQTQRDGTPGIKEQDNLLVDLYIRAINNRTRELNYLKLYSQLLRGDISNNYFNEEIDKNEDNYIVPAGSDADSDEIELALKIAPNLKDIETIEDFMNLFSFNDKSIRKYMAQNSSKVPDLQFDAMLLRELYKSSEESVSNTGSN